MSFHVRFISDFIPNATIDRRSPAGPAEVRPFDSFLMLLDLTAILSVALMPLWAPWAIDLGIRLLLRI